MLSRSRPLLVPPLLLAAGLVLPGCASEDPAVTESWPPAVTGAGTEAAESDDDAPAGEAARTQPERGEGEAVAAPEPPKPPQADLPEPPPGARFTVDAETYAEDPGKAIRESRDTSDGTSTPTSAREGLSQNQPEVAKELKQEVDDPNAQEAEEYRKGTRAAVKRSQKRTRDEHEALLERLEAGWEARQKASQERLDGLAEDWQREELVDRALEEATRRAREEGLPSTRVARDLVADAERTLNRREVSARAADREARKARRGLERLSSLGLADRGQEAEVSNAHQRSLDLEYERAFAELWLECTRVALVTLKRDLQ